MAAIVIIIIIIFLFLLLKKKQKSDEMALAVEEEIVEASEAREILEPVDIDELMLKYELEELSDEDFEDDMAPGSEEEQEVVVEE